MKIKNLNASNYLDDTMLGVSSEYYCKKFPNSCGATKKDELLDTPLSPKQEMDVISGYQDLNEPSIVKGNQKSI